MILLSFILLPGTCTIMNEIVAAAGGGVASRHSPFASKLPLVNRTDGRWTLTQITVHTGWMYYVLCVCVCAYVCACAAASVSFELQHFACSAK